MKNNVLQNIEIFEIEKNSRNKLLDKYSDEISVCDATCLYIPKGVKILKPIILSEIIGDVFKNLIIILDVSSRLTLIEKLDYLGADDKNRKVQIIVEEKSHFRYVHFSQISESSKVKEDIKSVVYKNGKICFFHGDFGVGRLQKNIKSNLVGKNSNSNIRTVYWCKEKSDFDIYIENKHINSTSKGDMIINTVGDNYAKIDVEGMIKISENTYDNVSLMKQKSLLLSDFVNLKVNPSLKIDADRVNSSHSSSVSYINSEDLFYFASRGISEELAKEILVKGFLMNIFDCMKDIFDLNNIYSDFRN